MLKKGDIVIIICVLASVLLSCALLFIPKPDGRTVTVKKDNEVIYSLLLNEDKVVKLDGNTIRIKNSKVIMEWADCENQLCVKQGEISRSGESIICLPHRVSVTIS